MREDLLKIINHYGVSNQVKKFNEEAFELEEAILKADGNIDDYINIIVEIADVLVMIGQFVNYYEIQPKAVKNIMIFKIARQLKRIEDENERND